MSRTGGAGGLSSSSAMADGLPAQKGKTVSTSSERDHRGRNSGGSTTTTRLQKTRNLAHSSDDSFPPETAARRWAGRGSPGTQVASTTVDRLEVISGRMSHTGTAQPRAEPRLRVHHHRKATSENGPAGLASLFFPWRPSFCLPSFVSLRGRAQIRRGWLQGAVRC